MKLYAVIFGACLPARQGIMTEKSYRNQISPLQKPRDR